MQRIILQFKIHIKSLSVPPFIVSFLRSWIMVVLIAPKFVQLLVFNLEQNTENNDIKGYYITKRISQLKLYCFVIFMNEEQK